VLNYFVVSSFRFNDFGVDGGPAAKYLSPKFNVFLHHVSTHSGLQVPEVQVRNAFICYYRRDYSRIILVCFVNLFLKTHCDL
jgi:hypothetical protein